MIFCNSPVTPLNISFFPRNVETLDKESILITLILILILSLLLALSQGKPSYSLVLFDDKNLETEHIKSSRFTYRPVRRFAKPPFLNSSFCFFLIFILYSFPKPAGWVVLGHNCPTITCNMPNQHTDSCVLLVTATLWWGRDIDELINLPVVKVWLQ